MDMKAEALALQVRHLQDLSGKTKEWALLAAQDAAAPPEHIPKSSSTPNDYAQENLSRGADFESALRASYDPRSGYEGEWHPSLFAYVDGDHLMGGSSDIDLTGKARVLLHGPYFYLFPGLWRIEVEFLFSLSTQECWLKFEFGEAVGLSAQEHRLDKSGRYSICIEHHWAELGPSQFRVTLIRPIFEGHLVIEKCRIRNISPLNQTTF